MARSVHFDVPYGVVALGCGLIILGSLIRIPFYPVPFTLQTLALSMIALSQPPKQAFASALCYLACASIGLPVLGWKVNVLWMTGKCGGYLIAFPIAAYMISYLRQLGSSFIALFLGQGLILAMGWIWLIPFIGMKEAFLKGVLFFIFPEIFKGCIALYFAKWRGL